MDEFYSAKFHETNDLETNDGHDDEEEVKQLQEKKLLLMNNDTTTHGASTTVEDLELCQKCSNNYFRFLQSFLLSSTIIHICNNNSL